MGMDGQVLCTYEDKGSNVNKMSAPRGIAADKDGNLLVADMDNDRLFVFDQSLTRAQVMSVCIDWGMQRPRSLWYDQLQRRLYIGEFDERGRVIVIDNLKSFSTCTNSASVQWRPDILKKTFLAARHCLLARVSLQFWTAEQWTCMDVLGGNFFTKRILFEISHLYNLPWHLRKQDRIVPVLISYTHVMLQLRHAIGQKSTGCKIPKAIISFIITNGFKSKTHRFLSFKVLSWSHLCIYLL